MGICTRVREELTHAQDAVSAMTASQTIDELECYWKEFLHALERVWSKAQSSHKGNVHWDGWKGAYVTERKQNQMLAYLRHARNAEEHTIADITEKTPGSVTIQAGPTGSAVVRSFTVSRNGTVEFQGLGSIETTFSPGRVELLDVVDRNGATYPPPSGSILDVARAGLHYYADFVDAMERRFS